uniref:Polypeptide N-acetylgalactosaminyltransferase n=1 Tax=Panagrellus redivivus TaxID=6233 RepID=A0A7E4ZTF9_PANRE
MIIHYPTTSTRHSTLQSVTFKNFNSGSFSDMRIGRYVPKKVVGLILYAAVLGSLYLVYSGLSSPSENVELSRAQPARLTVDGPDPFIMYKALGKKDWHDYELMKDEAARKGPGEQGTPVVVAKDDEDIRKQQEQLYRVNGYDAYVSDQIPLNRSVKDIRHKGCKDIRYIEKLPSVSVIFPFHNEHNTTLLRSVYSVIIRSPKDVLREVILVDDGSTKDFLKEPLEKYWKDVGLSHLVKVVRTGKREGLIRARQVGARHAVSDVLVFLDAHSEANYNWLPPLVEPIALDYRTVVCPFVDVIDCDTYEYRAQDEGARGSFDWEFNYKRLPLTPADQKNPTKPFDSPVMAGGYFAISTKWFWELGGYDEGLDIWGGEQYELSFKVWQCHGKMIDAPCSRVGHIYRCKYVPFPNPGIGDFLSRNYKRVAEVWMDEYKEHLYKRKGAIRNADEGDLSKQMEVRQRLKCKSFDWFMKEVAFDQDRYYPAVEPPDSANGELRNVAAQKCIDTQFKGANERFGLRKCISDAPNEGGEQNMRMSFWEDIRPMTRTVCFDASSSDNQAPVILFACHGMKGNQLFQYRIESRQIYHPISNHCIDCDPERGEIFLNPCENKPSQQWVWAHMNEEKIRERNAKPIV